MKKKNMQEGFAPLLILAIIAVLAIGGGAYMVTKNKKASVEDNPNTQANANADQNANENANLGVNANENAKKGSLRSFLGLGQNMKCTYSSTTKDGTSSSGTFYIGANGDMRGDFETKVGTQAPVVNNMIVKSGVSYVWSGNQGAKMDVPAVDTNATVPEASKGVEQLDAQMDYNCSPWTLDVSKFTPPTGVNFMDLNVLLKGGVNIPIPKN